MKNLILLFLLANLVSWSAILNLVHIYQNRLVFFDVGQGEAVLIQNGKNIFLYDTGRSGYKILQELRKYLPFFQKRIDLLFISHADQDHYQAAFDIFERYRVRYLITSKNFSDSGFQKLLRLAQSQGTKILFLNRGDEILNRAFQILVLHPTQNFQGEDNDLSLVLKVNGPENSFLLTGDIGQKAIQSLLSCCQNLLQSKFFLWPHHGSKYSLNLNFLQKVSPAKVIISVGPNRYGHPHKEVLQTLENLKIPIWRTDLNGSISLPL